MTDVEHASEIPPLGPRIGGAGGPWSSGGSGVGVRVAGRGVEVRMVVGVDVGVGVAVGAGVMNTENQVSAEAAVST